LDKKGVLFLPDGTMIPKTGTFATISLTGGMRPVNTFCHYRRLLISGKPPSGSIAE
jgi:hypothetical protein